jgi:hypothetical protein
MPKKPFDTDRFDKILPSQSPEEVRQLRENLDQDGCRDPLVVAEINGEKGQFLCDGLTRYSLCDELGIGFRTIIKKFDSEADVIHWMYNNQAGRRNWTQSQQSDVAEKWRQSVSRGNNGDGKKPSLREAAEKFDVNLSDMHAASVVHESGSEALKDAVASGEVSVRKGAVIAKHVPKRQQSIAIREGIDKANEEPKDLLDGLGNKVSKELREAFESVATFKRIMESISTLKGEINPLIGNPQEARLPLPGYEFLVANRQEIFRNLDQVREYLKFAIPYAECPKHEGKKCGLCAGAGFVTKTSYEKRGGK